MTSQPPDTPAVPPAGRVDNGLLATTYVPLTDVDDAVGRTLLTMLGRARIAAYLAPVELGPGPGPAAAAAAAGSDAPSAVGTRRLFVAADERSDARAIVAAAMRAMREPDGVAAVDETADDEAAADPLSGMDTDAAFAAIVADWHVDTLAAVREAERQLRQEDAEWRAKLQRPPVDEPVWLDEDHYVPPPPPPLPRLAGPTVAAMSLLALSILVLGLGGEFGLAANLSFLLGVCGVLVGAWMLVMRLRERRDDDDDGAVL